MRAAVRLSVLAVMLGCVLAGAWLINDVTRWREPTAAPATAPIGQAGPAAKAQGSRSSPATAQVEASAASKAQQRRVAFPPFDETGGRVPVTLAVWTFTAPDLAPPPPPPETTWRTSFGSERRTVRRPGARLGVTADVVAVTGVHDFRSLRAAFPARDWFLVAAPQLAALAIAQQDMSRPLQLAGIAVAVRRGSRIRIRGRLEIVAGQSDLDAVLSPVPADLQHAGAEVTAPFAVRLLVQATPLWIVIADLGEPCAAVSACAARNAATADWVRARREEGETVLLVERGTPLRVTLEAPRLDYGAGTDEPADAGCVRPTASIRGWGAADATGVSNTSALWRRRPTGGDCVLLVRLPIDAVPITSTSREALDLALPYDMTRDDPTAQ